MTPKRRLEAAEARTRLHTAASALSPRRLTFMEVCGTHTVNAFRAGLQSLLPENVRLLSGPGCPVCVTAQGEIDQMIDLADRSDLTICTYGDMLRVTGKSGSLQDARARGADVRVIYSAIDAVDLAQKEPTRQVVFAAVGFETTAPATAVAIKEAQKRNLANFSAVTSHKRILPAMHALLACPELRVDGFILPGHVAVITGSDCFQEIVIDYRLPCVVTGFEGAQILAALARLTELCLENRPRLENLYPQAVHPEGNRAAQHAIDQVFVPADAAWRGLGEIPFSGLSIREEFAGFDARIRFRLKTPRHTETPGCRCGDVIRGLIDPTACKLFATACNPIHPVGPCMVSSEGTCQAWFKYRRSEEALA